MEHGFKTSKSIVFSAWGQIESYKFDAHMKQILLVGIQAIYLWSLSRMALINMGNPLRGYGNSVFETIILLGESLFLSFLLKSENPSLFWSVVEA